MRKKLLIITGAAVILLAAGILAVHSWIGRSVRENIDTAMEKYPGSPEDALISFLQDEDNAMMDRTHIAIWSLGQIRSEKALPILKELYRDDPGGETCYGHHDSMLCQYEIHKAIRAIETGGFYHAGLRTRYP